MGVADRRGSSATRADGVDGGRQPVLGRLQRRDPFARHRGRWPGPSRRRARSRWCGDAGRHGAGRPSRATRTQGPHDRRRNRHRGDRLLDRRITAPVRPGDRGRRGRAGGRAGGERRRRNDLPRMGAGDHAGAGVRPARCDRPQPGAARVGGVRARDRPSGRTRVGTRRTPGRHRRHVDRHRRRTRAGARIARHCPRSPRARGAPPSLAGDSRHRRTRQRPGERRTVAASRARPPRP